MAALGIPLVVHHPLRDPDQDLSGAVRDAVSEGAVTVDVPSSDHEGDQRTISRFSMVRRTDEQGSEEWWVGPSRHHPLETG